MENLVKHFPSCFSMSAISCIENKHDVYRGKKHEKVFQTFKRTCNGDNKKWSF